MHEIYIGTIALERNRWNRDAGKAPTYLVSDWLGRFAQAGFDGIELWENHAALADERELARIEGAAFDVAVFNTYAAFSDDAAAAREQAAELTRRLDAGGVKFNLGHDTQRRDEYLRNARDWADRVPADARLLCECHAGSVLETPAAAADALRCWEDPRFQAIVHPFHVSPDALASWFEYCGDRITHAHVQMRDDEGKMIALHRQPERVRAALGIMRDGGFTGSFTIEFVEGTGDPDETPEGSLKQAVRDLEFLRAELAS